MYRTAVHRRLFTALVLLFSSLWMFGRGTVDTICVPTSHITSPAKAVVAVPERVSGKSYPVLYLLHGHGGNYADWSRNADLGSLADEYEMIIVCPDGRDSWYWDAPKMPYMQMESYIIEDLVPFVDSLYPTLPFSGFRAVTGLSMGGHGAFWLGVRHPDVFGNIGSMSGGLDITGFPDRWGMQRLLGRYAENMESWKHHSCMSLVDSIAPRHQNIIFDCGESDFFKEVNDNMHNALTARGVKHEYSTRPGAHTWAYWRQSLPIHLKYFKTCFDNASGK